MNGHEAVCKMLLSKGADATIVNNKGETTAQVGKTERLQEMLTGTSI